jgi:hypothetical protein
MQGGELEGTTIERCGEPRAADRGELGAALGQEVGSDLHPPLGEILHRRLAHEQRELPSHVGAGRGGLSG